MSSSEFKHKSFANFTAYKVTGFIAFVISENSEYKGSCGQFKPIHIVLVIELRFSHLTSLFFVLQVLQVRVESTLG